MRLLIRNIARIAGIDESGRDRVCGAEMDRLGTLDDAWLLADGERITLGNIFYCLLYTSPSPRDRG